MSSGPAKTKGVSFGSVQTGLNKKSRTENMIERKTLHKTADYNKKKEKKEKKSQATKKGMAIEPYLEIPPIDIGSQNIQCQKNHGQCKVHSNLQKSDKIIQDILQNIYELEHTIHINNQQEFQLRMALDQGDERVNELNFNLNNEKDRNNRLIQLIRGTVANSQDEQECDKSSSQQNLKLSLECVSPLLMQQRYDDLLASYNQSRRHLIKKDKQLTLAKCEDEENKAKYEELFAEYRNEHQRFQQTCGKFMTMKFEKDQKISQLKDALNIATDCILWAQKIVNKCVCNNGNSYKEFEQNLKYFTNALHQCC